MNNLETTIEALERLCRGSLSRQAGECLKLLKAARELLPGGSNSVEPTVLIYTSVPLQEVPRDLWPEDYEPQEPLGSPTEGTLASLVPIPVSLEAVTQEPDRDTLEALEAIAEDLAGYLDSPLVSFRDLKVALRDVVRELSMVSLPEAIPPMILGSRLEGDPEGVYRTSSGVLSFGLSLGQP